MPAFNTRLKDAVACPTFDAAILKPFPELIAVAYPLLAGLRAALRDSIDNSSVAELVSRAELQKLAVTFESHRRATQHLLSLANSSRRKISLKGLHKDARLQR